MIREAQKNMTKNTDNEINIVFDKEKNSQSLSYEFLYLFNILILYDDCQADS